MRLKRAHLLSFFIAICIVACSSEGDRENVEDEEWSDNLRRYVAGDEATREALLAGATNMERIAMYTAECSSLANPNYARWRLLIPYVREMVPAMIQVLEQSTPETKNLDPVIAVIQLAYYVQGTGEYDFWGDEEFLRAIDSLVAAHEGARSHKTIQYYLEMFLEPDIGQRRW